MPIFFSSSYFGASSVQVLRNSEIFANGNGGRKINTNEETFIELCKRKHNRYGSFKRSKMFLTAERTLQDEYIALSERFSKEFSEHYSKPNNEDDKLRYQRMNLWLRVFIRERENVEGKF